MAIRLWCFVLVFLVSSGSTLQEAQKPEDTSAEKPDYWAFKRGEYLRYNIHYGVIDAGEAIFEVKDTSILYQGSAHFYCQVTGKSYGWWDNFYKVRDYYVSYIDSASLLPTVYSRNVREGDYRNTENYWFDRSAKLAKGEYDGSETTVDIPVDVQDLVSMIYYMRGIDFSKKSPGHYRPLNVFFDKEWYACGVEMIGKEEVKTRSGKYKCIVVKPKLVEGRVFKGQDDMTVYVTDDKNQIPVRIESKIFVGSIQVDIEEYRNLKFPLTSKIK